MRQYGDVLKTAELFQGIGDADLSSMLACLGAVSSHFGKNQLVFLQGDRTGRFGVVLTGQVQIYQEDYYGNRSILGHAGPGDLFGESFAFAESETLPVSVLATAESELLFIGSHRLTTPCTRACVFHSRLIQNMLRIIAKKNLSLTRKIEVTSKRTTREKLLAYLSVQAQAAGSSRFSIPFNRQELADFLFVDRSAMSAQLSKLRDEGVLTFHKNQFQLQ